MNRMYLHSMALMALSAGAVSLDDDIVEIEYLDHIHDVPALPPEPGQSKRAARVYAPLDDPRPAPKEKSRSLKRMLRRKARA